MKLKYGIISLVIQEMEKVEKYKISGYDKKKHVMDEIELILDDQFSEDAFDVYQTVIELYIDWVCELTKGTCFINVNLDDDDKKCAIM